MTTSSPSIGDLHPVELLILLVWLVIEAIGRVLTDPPGAHPGSSSHHLLIMYCATCKHRDEDGYCNSPFITEDFGSLSAKIKRQALIYEYSEGGGFLVGPKFGCVHWEAKGDA